MADWLRGIDFVCFHARTALTARSKTRNCEAVRTATQHHSQSATNPNIRGNLTQKRTHQLAPSKVVKMVILVRLAHKATGNGDGSGSSRVPVVYVGILRKVRICPPPVALLRV